MKRRIMRRLSGLDPARPPISTSADDPVLRAILAVPVEAGSARTDQGIGSVVDPPRQPRRLVYTTVGAAATLAIAIGIVSLATGFDDAAREPGPATGPAATGDSALLPPSPSGAAATASDEPIEEPGPPPAIEDSNSRLEGLCATGMEPVKQKDSAGRNTGIEYPPYRILAERANRRIAVAAVATTWRYCLYELDDRGQVIWSDTQDKALARTELFPGEVSIEALLPQFKGSGEAIGPATIAIGRAAEFVTSLAPARGETVGQPGVLEMGWWVVWEDEIFDGLELTGSVVGQPRIHTLDPAVAEAQKRTVYEMLHPVADVEWGPMAIRVGSSGADLWGLRFGPSGSWGESASWSADLNYSENPEFLGMLAGGVALEGKLAGYPSVLDARYMDLSGPDNHLALGVVMGRLSQPGHGDGPVTSVALEDADGNRVQAQKAEGWWMVVAPVANRTAKLTLTWPDGTTTSQSVNLLDFWSAESPNNPQAPIRYPGVELLKQ